MTTPDAKAAAERLVKLHIQTQYNNNGPCGCDGCKVARALLAREAQTPPPSAEVAEIAKTHGMRFTPDLHPSWDVTKRDLVESRSFVDTLLRDNAALREALAAKGEEVGRLKAMVEAKY